MDRESVRRYEGRVPARPGDELVDQGLGFDLETVILKRRRVLRLFGLGTVGLGLAACGATLRAPRPRT